MAEEATAQTEMKNRVENDLYEFLKKRAEAEGLSGPKMETFDLLLRRTLFSSTEIQNLARAFVHNYQKALKGELELTSGERRVWRAEHGF